MTQITSFDSLMKASKEERKKLTKQELLDAVDAYSWYYTSNIREVKDAKDALVTQSKSEEAVKSLLIGYLNLPTKEKRDGYEYDVSYSLLDLVGRLLAVKS